MALSLSKKYGLGLLLLLALLSLAVGGFCLFMQSPSGGASQHERYLRLVYVLQSLGGPAHQEKEDIPARVIRSDETESLLHHTDRILVLRQVADELANMRKEHPRAAYYEACARMALGDRAAASALLAGYVVTAQYKSAHYALLCENLYELEDYPSLLLICQEWRERDPACQPDRARYAWASFHNLGRYAQARRLLSSEEGCLGWEAAVYDAKTALAAHGAAAAEQTLEHALKHYSENAMQITRLWNILKEKRRV